MVRVARRVLIDVWRNYKQLKFNRGCLKGGEVHLVRLELNVL